MAELTAQDISKDFNKLSLQDKAEVAKWIAQQNTKKAAATVPPVEKVKPWVELFDGLGDGIVKFAKDMGMTANELLNTPVGYITVGLVAYKVMGELITELIALFAWVSILTPLLLLYLFKITIPVVETKQITKARLFREPVTVDMPVRAKFRFSEGNGLARCLSFFFFLGVYVLGIAIIIA
jgi:hypothetical protein